MNYLENCLLFSNQLMSHLSIEGFSLWPKGGKTPAYECGKVPDGLREEAEQFERKRQEWMETKEGVWFALKGVGQCFLVSKDKEWLNDSVPELWVGVFNRLAKVLRKASKGGESLDKKMQQHLDTIVVMARRLGNNIQEEEARRMLELIIQSGEDLIGEVQSQHGKQVVQPEPFSIGQLCAELEGIYGPKAREKGLIFSLILSGVPDGLMGDKLCIRQALMPLLDNALKFTPNGKVSLEIFSKEIKEGSCRVHFKIEDTGVGITQDRLGRIFEFFSPSNDLLPDSSGVTGLGLGISKKIIEAMDGKLLVRSEPKKGSTFHFALDLPLSGPMEVEGDAIDADYAKLKGVRVLVAEDNVCNQLLLQKMLENVEADFEIVDNGLDAVEELKRKVFDVVLMDVQMPTMDGLEAVQQIRGVLNLGIPVVAMSSRSANADRLRYMYAGMDELLAKPFDNVELSTVLVSLLRKRGQDVGKKCFSLTRLEEMAGNDIHFIKNMMNSMVRDVTGLLGGIACSWKRGDMEQVIDLGHQLRGTCDFFDAKILVEAIDDMEQGFEQGVGLREFGNCVNQVKLAGHEFLSQLRGELTLMR